MNKEEQRKEYLIEKALEETRQKVAKFIKEKGAVQYTRDIDYEKVKKRFLKGQL